MNNLDNFALKLTQLRQSIEELARLRPRTLELDSITSALTETNVGLHDEVQRYQELLERRYPFFDLSLDMLCVADTEGRFLDVNPSFERVLGYSKKELLAHPYIDFVHPEDRESTIKEAQKITEGSDAINFENRYRCKDGSWKWLNWVCPALTANNRFMYAIAHDITEQKRNEAEILYQAQHDTLTGLLNRSSLRQELQLAIERHRRDPTYNVALMFIDLDGFKSVNDEYGHDIGDSLLKEVAVRLQALCRNTDTVARQGGDEFVVLTQGHLLHVEELSLRLQTSLSEPYQFDGVTAYIGVSIGTAHMTQFDHDGDQLLHLADQAMYKLKKSKKGAEPFNPHVSRS